jgi:ketosteroid isomerase-like protein
MHRVYSRLLLVVATLGAAAILPPVSILAQDVPTWALEANRSFYKAYNSANLAALMKHYAIDAVILLPDKAIRGRAAIEAFFSADFARARSSCEWTIDGAQAVGRHAAVWGHEKCVEAPKSGKPSRTLNYRWLTVWERQPDRSWLIARDAFEDAKP